MEGLEILEQVAEQRTRITDGLAGVRHALNRCWSPYFPDEPAMTPATFKRSIRDLQVWCSSCMVAFSGSDPIGVLIGAKRPSGTLVQKTAVHPDHRRQGHGRHLLASLVIEDGGARLKQLLSRLRVGGITTLRFPKIHPAEISKELLVSRPRNSWRKCRCAAPRWQGATSENIGHI